MITYTHLDQIVFGVEVIRGRFYDFAHRRESRRETKQAQFDQNYVGIYTDGDANAI